MNCMSTVMLQYTVVFNDTTVSNVSLENLNCKSQKFLSFLKLGRIAF